MLFLDMIMWLLLKMTLWLLLEMILRLLLQVILWLLLEMILVLIKKNQPRTRVTRVRELIFFNQPSRNWRLLKKHLWSSTRLFSFQRRRARRATATTASAIF